MSITRTFASRLLPRLFLGTALLIFIVGNISGQRREPTVSEWQPLHYEVAITLNEPLTEIASARATLTTKLLTDNLTKIALDFGDLTIDSVLVGQTPAQFERLPDQITVALPQPSKRGEQLTITFTYHGRPKDGLIFASDRDGRPSATGDNWPNRVHHWIPSLDHPSAKATVFFTITAPAREQVVANGRLMSMTSAGPNTVWTFDESKPIPAYCMVIAVSEGAKIDAPATSVTPLSYYVPQRDRAYATKGFASAGLAVALFSEMIAPFPYEKLALIVGATRFGGMENSSAIVFTNTLFEPRGNEKLSKRFGIPARIEDVVAHEIAHQWFGDSVTESTWADLWLSEGFATYFAGLFVEKYEGEEAFRTYMREAAARSFGYEQQRNLPIHDTETQDLMRLLNPNNYEKGAWVLHMLRRRLGDQPFFRGLRDYYKEHAHANASTEDLRQALERASGKDLKEFFARWIYGAGHPRYQISWVPAQKRGTAVQVTLTQLQQGEAFLDPVPVVFTVKGQPRQEIIYPKGKETMVTLRLGSSPAAATIDPNETLLREIVTKP